MRLIYIRQREIQFKQYIDLDGIFIWLGLHSARQLDSTISLYSMCFSFYCQRVGNIERDLAAAAILLECLCSGNAGHGDGSICCSQFPVR